MTYVELIEWAKAQGKSEEDVLRWYAYSEVDSIREMTDRELVDYLVAGIKYDASFVQEHWKDLDESDQANYRMYMSDHWKGI